MPKEATFEVTLFPAPIVAQTVNYTTRDGTARVADKDYTPRSGTLIFQPGEVRKSVVVQVTDPSPNEPSEIFYLDLTLPVGSKNTLGRATAVCVIPKG